MCKVSAKISFSDYARIILFLVLSMSFSSVFSQYGPFYTKERQLKNYQVYDKYISSIIKYNKDRDFDYLTGVLDSLADISLKEDNFEQFLFMKNELSNLYKIQSKYLKSYDELVNSMKVFKAEKDTIHNQYHVSLRLLRTTLNKIINLPGKEDFKCRSQEEIYQSMFKLLDLLDEKGEPMRNTMVDYGMHLMRTDQIKEGITNLYKARGLALDADDLASLAVADYTLLSNMPTSFDLLKTKNEVYEADIKLFESEKAFIPVLMYNAYFLTRVSQNYAQYFYNIDKAIEYATKAAELLDTLKYPAHSIKAATHGNLATYYASLGDTSKMWSSVKVAKHLAKTQAMNIYNRAFPFKLIAEATSAIAPDSSLIYLQALDSLPGKKYFDDQIIRIKSNAFLNKGLLSEAHDIILTAFDSVEILAGFKVPVISSESSYFEQIQLMQILQNIYAKTGQVENKNYTPAIVNLIMKQNELFQTIMTEDIYGFEISSLAKHYNKFIQKNLPYLFDLPLNEYGEQRHLLALSSKGIHLSTLMAKNQYQSLLENDTTVFSKLLKSSHKVQQSRNKIAKADYVKMELNSNLIDNLMYRFEFEESMQNTESKKPMVNTIADVSDIQSQLEANEAMIEYYVFNDSWAQLLILQDTALTFYHKNNSLYDKIGKERYAILTGRGTTSIGETLFKDIKPFLSNIHKLVIIPDANLNYIPFEVMELDENKLIMDYAISYSYSANSWYNLRVGNENSTPENILTIAPIFENLDQKAKQQPAIAYRGEGSLEPLPSSLNEVNGIAEKVAEAQINISHLTGKNATIENVKSKLAEFDIIHFATHGLVNANYPERSGLFLYNNSEQNEQNVGLLTLGELFNMQLKAQLMVLSACNTGRGDYLEGEGIMALPRGGILAGVPGVIASLWKVHDEFTKNLMLDFYSYVSKGYSYREALRQAKLDAIKKDRLPLDWAGFILIGR
jgi:CHAT domain-containing protein